MLLNLPPFLQTRKEIPLSIITSQNPARLSKGFQLSEEGELQKLPGGQLVDGTIETKKVENANGLAELISGLSPNQALCYGTSAHSLARIVPKKDIGEVDDGEMPVIARTREYLSYPSGPAVMMLDYDAVESGPELNVPTLLGQLYEAWPELKSAPHVTRPSASSCIYNDEQELRGVKGIRVWVIVENGQDIPRAGKALYQRTWLKGYGHIQVSAAGSLLNRSLIDVSVYQPERLDFSGGAECVPPLTQQLPEPLVINNEAAPVRTDTTLLDLNADEIDLYDRLIADARRAAKPKAKVVRDAWVEKQVDKITAADPFFAALDAESKEIRIRELRKTYHSAVENNTLEPEFQIVLESGDVVSVSEILNNPEKYRGLHCADPLEPDYNNDTRIGTIFASGRNVHIWSFAHGGQRFNLSRGRETVRIIKGAKAEIAQKIADIVREQNKVFIRGSEIVKVEADGNFRPMSVENIAYHLDSSISFLKAKDNCCVYKPCDCPGAYAKTIFSEGRSLDLPELQTAFTAPIMDPGTGRIIDKDGYDKSTMSFLIMNDPNAWPGVPDDPSDSDIEDAVGYLSYPYKDFAFCGPIDRAVALSAILTAVIRPLLPTAPGILIDAPTAGTGKTLFCLSLSSLAGDATPSVYPGIGKSEEELRKRITALLRENNKAIIFDNLTGQIESAVLCAMLTSGYYSDRLLGQSVISKVPSRVMCLFNGNNVLLKGDICRRVLTARIDPVMEKPWARKFKINPASYVAENRLKMVAAVLTILRAVRMSGFELNDSIASFELWSDVVRTAVIWIGNRNLLDVGDPKDSISQSFYEDPETINLGSLLASWFTAFGSNPKTVAECAAYAKANTQTTGMYQILEDITEESGKEINSKKLGNWISKVKGRIVDDMKFEKYGQKHKVTRWKVTKMKSAVIEVLEDTPVSFYSDPDTGKVEVPEEGTSDPFDTKSDWTDIDNVSLF